MQYSQKNFMRIIGNDQKNNGQNIWEILERIIGKISSIIGAGLFIYKSILLLTMSCVYQRIRHTNELLKNIFSSIMNMQHILIMIVMKKDICILMKL